MTTLRVLVDGAPARGHAQSWALFDDAGACVRTGRAAPEGWPAAEHVEAVLAASQVRIASIALPPLAPARVAAAAAFAVDDQLAGPPDAHHLAVSTQQTGGRVRVVIATRALVAALRDRHAVGGPFTRVMAEPDLAIPYAGWRWCAAARSREGFARRSDGSAFPVSATSGSDEFPAVLALALAHARRDGKPPSEVRVECDAADADLVRWRQETGVAFVRGGPWHWSSAPAAAFGGAVDLLQGDFALTGPPPAGGRGRLFVPALALAAAALAVHVVATLGEWGALRIDGWRQAREWNALATSAGVAPDAASTPAAAQAAIVKRYSELRHAQGMPAPGDALPLLARAAPALRALPAAGVKSASYADGHWTLDLTRADPAAIAELDAHLRQAGVPTIVATSATGARIRMGAW
jgi:type II secretion system protein L